MLLAALPGGASAVVSSSRRASAGRAVVSVLIGCQAPEARSDRFLERRGGDEVALVVDGDLQLGKRALGRAEDHLAVLA